MKLADMNPNTGLAFRPVGRHIRMGMWTLKDEVDSDGIQFRQVWHYGTLMGEFYKLVANYTTGQGANEHEVFQFAPLSTGYGSASDQQGMNKMLAGTGWQFRRNGGVARYEHTDGVRRFPH